MVTFADLRDARLAPLNTAAGAWHRYATGQRRLEHRVTTDLAGPLRRGGWQGDAADAALTRMTSLHDEFELYAVKTANLTAVLHQAATSFRRHQLNLHAAIEAATGLGLRVTDDGRVLADEVPLSTLSDPGALETNRLAVRNAESYADLIASIVVEAGRTDLNFADALRKLAPEAQGVDDFSWGRATDAARAAAALAGLAASTIPPPGSDPVQAAAWWRGLTDGQRELLLTAYPAAIGNLDGLPAGDRDRANRMALHELIGDHLNSYGDPDDPRQQRLVRLLDRLNDADFQTRQPLYLLGIDNQATGHAIVAVGDPDSAAHTAVLVPGVSTNLGGMRGQISRAGAIQDAAQAMGMGDVSVIAWLDYDPPQLDGSVVTAAGSGRAEAGAVTLDRFTAGLHAGHDPGPSHLTAIGHSYGSVLVGNAASGSNHLGVTDIVTAGSPGMDVASAGDLDVGPRHVWAAAPADDPVASPGTAIPYVGGVVEQGMAVGHQTAPHQPGFGGNVSHVDTRGHSGYWTQGSQSLANQARIVTGQYDLVTLDAGKAPS